MTSVFQTAFSFALFYICWGMSQLVSIKTQHSLLSSLLFSTVFTGLAGALVPIYLKNKFRWSYNRSSSNRPLGYLFLILALVFSTVLSGALIKVVELQYLWDLILKYILLFFPMSLAIGLYAFLLIPNLIPDWKGIKGALLVFSIGTFFFLAFYIDSLFQDMMLAATMGFIGLLLGLGYLFLRNFWVVYSVLFIIMLINTMADNKYDDYNLGVVIVSTLLSLAILGFDLIKNKRNLGT
ncbi:MAG TPA: hypothetical protein P5317_04205 [Myxococcota bacterium]|nr:hypothetical protein [Myxococcota bacterium]